MGTATPTVRAPRVRTLTCKGWPQEAARRMRTNHLDPEDIRATDDAAIEALEMFGAHGGRGPGREPDAAPPATAAREGLRLPMREERAW